MASVCGCVRSSVLIFYACFMFQCIWISHAESLLSADWSRLCDVGQYGIIDWRSGFASYLKHHLRPPVSLCSPSFYAYDLCNSYKCLVVNRTLTFSSAGMFYPSVSTVTSEVVHTGQSLMGYEKNTQADSQNFTEELSFGWFLYHKKTGTNRIRLHFIQLVITELLQTMTMGNHAPVWKDMLVWTIRGGEVKNVKGARTADLIWIMVAVGHKLAWLLLSIKIINHKDGI